ncbi:SDR family oxidoreductase [Ktedonosporobacter rubrisoli]
MSVADQHIVIIGGSSGIGLATAKMLAEQGAKVTIAARQREKLVQASVSIEQQVAYDVVNASVLEEVQAFFKRVGSFDHLVLTLGSSEGMGDFRTLDFTMLRRAFETKYWAQLQAAQASLDYLRKDGSLTFVSAVSARTASAGAAGLATLNGALEAIIPSLALELQPLRVNAVSPGLIDTPWWSGFPSEMREAIFAQITAATPVKRAGRAEDVAQAIAFLIKNTFMAGTILECDGGARIR